MAFADLSSELSGVLQGLSGFLADSFINRAWLRIQAARTWAFLIDDDSIVCPTAITAGSYAVTQYSDQVIANAAASAALNALPVALLPVTFLQFRVQGPGSAGQIYNIADSDNTNPNAWVLTLDRVVAEASNAASSYMIYRPYISLPVSDFLRFISVVDVVNGWTVNLDFTSTAFDAKDPQRSSVGQSFFLGFYLMTSDGVPRYELWPGPTQGQTFYVRYRHAGQPFVNPDDTQPPLIPDDLIVQCALGFYAYPWAMANQGHFPAMQKVNWMNLITDAKKTYFNVLQEAKRQDDNQALQSVWNRGHGLRGSGAGVPWPADAAFLQSHLLPF